MPQQQQQRQDPKSVSLFRAFLSRIIYSHRIFPTRNDDKLTRNDGTQIYENVAMH